jgi:TolB protein
MLNFIFLLAPTLLFTSSVFAQSTYLQVGEAKTKKAVVALTPGIAAPESATGALSQVEKTIQSDLEFIDAFRILPAAGFPQNKITASEQIKYADWAKSGTDYLSFGSFKLDGSNAVFEFHLMNIGGNKEVLAKRYTSESSELKILGHSIANDIVNAITGKKGIFLTRIAFICDKTGKKEIFSSSFDGSDVRQVTRIRSLTMAPAWSPDGQKIAFAVYNRHSDNTKNIDLFEMNLRTGGLKLLSNRKGINSGASYSPSGDKLAYTMSYTGNPEVHVLNLETKETSQLTHSIGFDVDPAWSPDGQKLAFVSSRPGKPMLYTLDLKNPADAKRLTYAGSYNATPAWSPDGKKIAFAGWLDKRFDLFTITSDGGKIERLTKDEGNNEDPHYSPDGSFLVFSSSRSGGKNIFIMGSEGGNVKRLTFGMGECVAPKWSPYL